jgi:hypothetical protein
MLILGLNKLIEINPCLPGYNGDKYLFNIDPLKSFLGYKIINGKSTFLFLGGVSPPASASALALK